MTRKTTAKSVPKSDAPAPASELARHLRHTFTRPELLTLALTHRSWIYDTPNLEPTPGPQDNEALEFIGDAALGLLTAEFLFARFPAAREGELTRMRASVVSRRHLGEVGTRLDLGRWLRLGHTAESNGARRNAALFSNTVEAIIAALYLDGGLPAARQFVEREILLPALPSFTSSISAASDSPERFSQAVGDHKSALQELLQASRAGRPEYRLLSSSGPDHSRLFRMEVLLTGIPDAPDRPLAQAEAATKKAAQQEAARLAVSLLEAEASR